MGEMITIDALYFLLLVEFALIMLAFSVYLSMKNKKHKMLYQKVLKELKDIKTIEEQRLKEQIPVQQQELSQRPRSEMSEDRDTAILKENKDLVSKIRELEEMLNGKNNQLENLQKKIKYLENEYEILYKKHQSNQ